MVTCRSWCWYLTNVHECNFLLSLYHQHFKCPQFNIYPTRNKDSICRDSPNSSISLVAALLEPYVNTLISKQIRSLTFQISGMLYFVEVRHKWDTIHWVIRRTISKSSERWFGIILRVRLLHELYDRRTSYQSVVWTANARQGVLWEPNFIKKKKSYWYIPPQTITKSCNRTPVFGIHTWIRSTLNLSWISMSASLTWCFRF